MISPKRIEDPVIIYTYDSTSKGRDGNRRSGANYAVSLAVEMSLEKLLEYKKKENKTPGSILLLGRFGFDGDQLERSGLFEYIRRGDKIKSVKYPDLDITFMTAHSSKGLGYDDVIVVNGKNETYGFPAKIEDDPVLAFVIKGDRTIDYAEERRLFYVAMTRTKNRVFFVAPEQNPSEFLIELKRDYKNIVLQGDWNEDVAKTQKKACPFCGYPLQLKYKKAYGLRLYMCTNEPEVCGFMTNDYRAGKMSIQKCDRCRDGYLIVKQGKDAGFFLGCTNYKSNGTGCSKMLNKKYFYEQMRYEMEDPVVSLSDENSCKTQSDLLLQGKMTSVKEKTAVNKELKNDYVAIARAEIAPVYYEDYDLNEVIFTVVKALQNVSRDKFYGKTVLIEVLRGINSKKIFEKQLHTVAEFGTLKEMPHDTIASIVEWMISEHLILKTKGKYPVLHSTYEGLHYSENITVHKLKKLKKYLEEEVILWNQ